MAEAIQVESLIAGLIGTNGLPLVDGTIGFFQSDGVTLKPIWKDADKLVEADNPLTFDVMGTGVVFADGIYSTEVKDSSGSVIKTRESLSYLPEGSVSGGSFGIDASNFGSGDDTDAILQAIASALGADATVFLIPQQWDIDGDLTIPSNINLKFLFGAFAQIQVGITLNIVGKLEAELYNIFRGPGSLLLDLANNDIPTIWLQAGIDGNRNFEGDVAFDTDTLFIDSDTGRAGVGNIIPFFPLDVTGDIRIRDTGSLRFFGIGPIDSDVGLTRSALNTLQIDGNFDLNSNNLLNVGILGLGILNVTTINATTIGATTITSDTGNITAVNATTVGATTITGTNLVGTIITASQPNITSLGILSSLTMGGDIDLGANDIVNADSITGTSLVGAIITVRQPNITSLGILTGLTMGGDIDLSSNSLINGDLIQADRSEIGRRIIKITSTVNAGTSINAAIASLGGGGGIIYCPIGTYSIDVTIGVNFDNISIIGDGSSLTIFQSNGVVTNMISQTINSNELSLKGIDFDGSAGTTADRCYHATGSNSVLKATDCIFSGASLSLIGDPPDNSVISNCDFNIPTNSMGIDNLEDQSIVQKCSFSGDVATSIGVEASGDGGRIRDCLFSGIFIGVQFDTANAVNTIIEGNIFDGCASGINGGVVIVNNTFIRKNTFFSCTSVSISLGRPDTFTIDDNVIVDQTGINCISIERCGFNQLRYN